MFSSQIDLKPILIDSESEIGPRKVLIRIIFDFQLNQIFKIFYNLSEITIKNFKTKFSKLFIILIDLKVVLIDSGSETESRKLHYYKNQEIKFSGKKCGSVTHNKLIMGPGPIFFSRNFYFSIFVFKHFSGINF